MPSKFSRFAEGLMEAVWLAALIIVPVFFNVYSSRIFEPDKIAILRSLALLGLGAWVVKIVEQGRLELGKFKNENESVFRSMMRIPMVPAVLSLVLIYIIATIFSISPRISFFGSYQRLQGTFTAFSYLVLFAMTASQLRRKEQIDRIIFVIILSSLSISLYGVLQKFEIDPIPWGGDTSSRVAGNMGNAIFIAAYMIMAFPLTLGRIVDSFSKILDENVDRLTPQVGRGIVYVFTAAMQLIAIYFSLSRGPILGLLAGTFFMFLLLSLYWGKRWLTMTTIGAAAAMGAFLITLSIPGGPLESLRSNDNIGRLGNVFETDSGTGKVRVLIWEGASQLSWWHDPIEFPDGSKDSVNAIRPLIGYGPETMYVAYNPFYPPELGSIESRNATPDRSHNETWDAVVITGWIGLAAEQFLFMSVFFFGLKWLGLIRTPRQQSLFYGLTIGGGLLSSAAFTYFINLGFLGVALPFGILIGLLAYLTFVSVFSRYDAPTDEGEKARSLTLMMFLGAIIAHYVEIHFGIAIAATRTYFWVFAGVMLATGYWMTLEGGFGAKAQAALGIEVKSQEVKAVKSVNSKTKGRGKARRKGIVTDHQKLYTWSLGLITGLLLSTLTYNFIMNTDNNINAGVIIANSLTKIPGEALSTYGIAGIFLICWIAAAVLASSEWSRDNVEGSRYVLLVTAAVSASVWLIYAYLHASGMINVLRQAAAQAADAGPLDQVLRQSIAIEGLLARFYILMFLLILWIASRLGAMRPSSTSKKTLSLSSTVAIGGTFLLVIFFASQLNLKVVQADMAFKVGDPFARGDDPENWRTSIEIYKRANELSPQQDHYSLFLGRGYLELTRLIQDNSPAEAENLLTQAEADLERAQQINPLNTDHTANLARLHRFWSKLQGVDAESHLNTSEYHYGRALVLSPNNSGIWNELATLNLQERNDPEAALETLLISAEIDPYNDATFGILGDYYSARFQSLTDPAEKAEAAQKSIDYFKEAAQVAKRKTARFQYQVGLARLYTNIQDIDKAVATYEEALENANASQIWVIKDTIAKVLAQNERFEDALFYAVQAFEDAPEEQKPAQQQLIDYLQGIIPTQE